MGLDHGAWARRALAGCGSWLAGGKVGIAAAAAIIVSVSAQGQIYNWQSGQVIPGTQAITPGPGVMLSGWNTSGQNLRFAALGVLDLTGATFAGSWLDDANFFQSDLQGVDFSGATIERTNFTKALHLTEAQLASTASYQNHSLTGIHLGYLNLGGWDFTSQNLGQADLTGAVLTSADLQDADLSGAIVRGATIRDAKNLTRDQLYSTASYQNHDLAGVVFGGFDRWDLSNQDMTGADFSGVTISNTYFAGATLDGATFRDVHVNSTSFLNASAVGADFMRADVVQCSLIHMDLTNSDFTQAKASSTIFLASDLTGAVFTDALITGANFRDAKGLTQQQFYSTHSYKVRNLGPISLEGQTMQGWDFSGQQMYKASMDAANLDRADFRHAEMRAASLENVSLIRADLGNALLTASSFRNANLSHANLSDAQLQGADFLSAVVDYADLTRANLYGATGFNSQAPALTLRATIMPDGYVRQPVLLENEYWRIAECAGKVYVTEPITMARGSEISIDATKISQKAGMAMSMDIVDQALLTMGGTDLELSRINIHRGGMLQGGGWLRGEVLNEGVIATQYRLQVVGSLRSTGELRMRVSGSDDIMSDQVIVYGNLALGGLVEVLPLGIFTPTAWESFDLLDWTGNLIDLGVRLDLSHLTLPEDLIWDTSQFSLNGTIQVVPVGDLPLPGWIAGDFNHSGRVDVQDINPFILAMRDPQGYLDYVRDDLGITITSRQVNGLFASLDPSGNGMIDIQDITPFTRMLTGQSTTVMQAVPEPSGLLAVLAGVGVYAMRRRC
ncbi:MAG: pentapeptide repeat-containing protein [Phycisphaeraceae bacterium]|nr:pentapeptide repeat-containing protein [Phycisphaeraceae bacterium]